MFSYKLIMKYNIRLNTNFDNKTYQISLDTIWIYMTFLTSKKKKTKLYTAELWTHQDIYETSS